MNDGLQEMSVTLWSDSEKVAEDTPVDSASDMEVLSEEDIVSNGENIGGSEHNEDLPLDGGSEPAVKHFCVHVWFHMHTYYIYKHTDAQVSKNSFCTTSYLGDPD